jgi:predicted Rossmann fold nucleotide-binding protein DprA/Smf involved in DNA uptake
MLVSGGAKGIDQAAMRGALDAGGQVSGVLADSLEKTTLNREHRNLLLDGQLVLISPYDPSAGFNVGNAMQRNKLIYALADASLVVSSDINKGGTWAGATEQLDKFKFAPVYVRATGEPNAALDALQRKGAIPWPNPQDTDAFEGVFDVAPAASTQPGLGLFPKESATEVVPERPAVSEPESLIEAPSSQVEYATGQGLSVNQVHEPDPETTCWTATPEPTPANALLTTVREVIQRLLKIPMKEAEVAAALEVSTAQAKAWLLRLVQDGVLEKQKRPAAYVVKRSSLFENPTTTGR